MVFLFGHILCLVWADFFLSFFVVFFACFGAGLEREKVLLWESKGDSQGRLGGPVPPHSSRCLSPSISSSGRPVRIHSFPEGNKLLGA